MADESILPAGAPVPDEIERSVLIRASAETVQGAPGPVPAATAEETERVLRWLESPGIRLVDVEGDWVCPVAGAARHLAVYDAVTQSRLSLTPFDEQRLPSPVHRPVR